jgi:hypothetical protein
MVTLSSGNTEMTCRTSEGYGSNHRWTVKFQNSMTSKIEGTFTTSPDVTSSYATPVITRFEISTNSLHSTVNKDQTIHSMNTIGGTVVLMTGENMGPLGMETCTTGSNNDVPCMHHSATSNFVGYYGSNGGGYCASNCVVVVANTQVQCSTSGGIGSRHHWRLRQPDHDIYGEISLNSTSYAVPTIADVQCWNTNDDGSETRCPGGSNDGNNDYTGRVFSTHGTDRVKIIGTNFGPKDDPMGTRIINIFICYS